MKTYMAKAETVQRKWYIVDAEGKVLGRLATQIANILRGKNKPTYTPHVDTGDFVIVINAEKVAVTGKKESQKIYRRHTLHPGGLKEVTFSEMLAKKPENIIIEAVKGMLPKNSLGKNMLKKLRVYPGGQHKHQAQNPIPLELE